MNTAVEMKIIAVAFLCINCFMICVDSQIIAARVGSTVVLPCKLVHMSGQKPYVQWSSNFETVFERKGDKMFEAEGYQGRVDVPEDKLLKGNCSLVLKDIKASDEGVYESYLSVKRVARAASAKWVLVQTVELKIDDSPIPTKKTPERVEYMKLTLTDAAGMKRPHPLIVILCSIISCCLFLPHKTILSPFFD